MAANVDTFGGGADDALERLGGELAALGGLEEPVLSQNSVAPVRPHKSGPGGDSQQRVRARQHWPYGLGLWRLLRMTERLFPLYAAWRW